MKPLGAGWGGAGAGAGTAIAGGSATKLTHWPWFLNGMPLRSVSCRQPPFLHCFLLVGGFATVTLAITW